MDDSVVRSLVKWPTVANCFGWLALDRRGAWRMRDDYAQAHGLPGDAIKHEALNAFIARNYASDNEGRYFFQNGPQRVYINLYATPWVVRMMPTGHAEHPWQFQTQCKSLFLPSAAFLDEAGHILIEGKLTQTICTGVAPNQFNEIERLSIALLHDHDIELFSQLVSLDHATCSPEGIWLWHGHDLKLEPITTTEVQSRFQFQTQPQA
jgi:hypothetical protein